MSLDHFIIILFSVSVSWPCRPVSGQDRGMTIFFRPIIAIIGPGAPGLDQSRFLSLLSSDTWPGAMQLHPPSLDPAYHCQVIVGLINFAVKKFPSPNKVVTLEPLQLGCTTYPAQNCAPASAYLGRASLGLTRKFVLTPLTQILLEITAHFCA